MSEQFEVVKLTSKGQMTLPASIRKLLGIKEGDHLAVTVVICQLVYAELAALITDTLQLDAFLRAAGVKLEPFSLQALLHAGKAWRIYTERRPGKMVCPGF